MPGICLPAVNPEEYGFNFWRFWLNRTVNGEPGTLVVLLRLMDGFNGHIMVRLILDMWKDEGNICS